MQTQRLFDIKARQEIVNKKTAIGETLSIRPWEPGTQARLGSVLISLLMDVAQVPVNKDLPNILQFPSDPKHFLSKSVGQVIWEPALTHSQIIREGKRLGVFNMHQAVLKRFEDGFSKSVGSNVFLPPSLMPMVVPPQPWFGYNSGGYWSIKCMSFIAISYLISCVCSGVRARYDG